MNCFCFPCQPASCVYECVFARIADANLYACSCVWQTKKLLCNFKCVPLQVQLTVHFRFLPGKLCTSAHWQDLSQEPTCLQLRPMHFSRFSLSISLSVSESVQQSSHICQKMCLSFVSLTMHYSGARMRGAHIQQGFVSCLTASLHWNCHRTHALGLEHCPKGCRMIMCRCRRSTSQVLRVWKFSRY